MQRTRLRALRRRCQTWHSAEYARNEDQIIEDQQASFQGDRSPGRQLSPHQPFASILAGICTESANCRNPPISACGNIFSFNSLRWRVTCTVTATNGMLRIHRTGNGEVVFTVSGRIDEEDISELEALI